MIACNLDSPCPLLAMRLPRDPLTSCIVLNQNDRPLDRLNRAASNLLPKKSFLAESPCSTQLAFKFIVQGRRLVK